jgi:hypothetical protein
MRFLDRLRRGSRAPHVELDPRLSSIYDRVALPALRHQIPLADRFGEPDWLLDQDAGTPRLGDQILPAEIIGLDSGILVDVARVVGQRVGRAAIDASRRVAA